MAMLDSPARQFLQTLPDHHEPLKAILMISAHWEASQLTVSHAREFETIHDFYGFPPEFYDIHYPAQGNPALAERIAGLITAANLGDVASVARGLDHGAWLPLMLGYPEAQIPITQLSLRSGGGPDWHFRLGASLRPLRNEGILVLCSGALTHNLREMDRQAQPGDTAQWAEEFASWITKNAHCARTSDNQFQWGPWGGRRWLVTPYFVPPRMLHA
jgi:4,5-DOPA dioxygenase extradiol